MKTLEQRVQALEDEGAIRNLAAAFADAATRNNMHELAEIWKQDGTLTIGAPMLNVSKGIKEIIGFLSKLRGNKEFFVQLVNSGVIEVIGEEATAQWIIEEAAKGGDKYYRNYCVVSDRLEKIEGKWLIAERYFHYAHLDSSPFTGDSFELPSALPSV